MEKTYQILKILIAVLILAIVLTAILRSAPAAGPVPESIPAQTAPTGTEAPSPADAAPDFTVYDLEGAPVKLSDFLGQPVILNFWASWCGPCKAEMPDLQKAYETYGQDIAFLTVNLTDGRSETLETASAYIAQQGYTFPVYYDTAMEAAYAYQLTSIPRTYFIDREGRLVGSVTQMISAQELQSGIDLLLQAP